MAQDAKRPRRFPQVSVDYGDAVLDAVEQLATELGKTRSWVLRDLVEYRLRELGRLPESAKEVA